MMGSIARAGRSQNMLNRVVTISREYGSGGSIIARQVAEALGIPCYDAELIEKIAAESGYDVDFIKEKANTRRADTSPPCLRTGPWA